ncbi:MAG TPA: response regulator [Acetobacteraceae bacterium]|nr:response regulator [Acetobacteraceae bacterium]
MNDVRKRILVVDDDDGGRYLKAHILRKHGYVVEEAGSGAEALARCGTARPDLVLLDVILPDMSGVDLSRQIRTDFPAVAVLQTSAAITTARDRALSLAGGADAFLVEPIEPEELLATVNALLRMHAAEQALRRMNETLEDAVAERTRELTEAYRRLEAEADERRKAEQVLWHTQKLDAVGQLTGGIAHDFNNLLAVIVGSLEMIRSSLDTSAEFPRAKVQRLLRAAEAATDRGTKLTRQLMTFARRSTLQPETVKVDAVLHACEPFLRRALGEAITFRLDFDPALWPCRIDPVQFEAAILNLVVNARDAMPNGGMLEIAAVNVTVATPLLEPSGALDPGDYVCIRVTDTGVGMGPDIAARAFEPFFTTKEVGRGTGLGLSQVYGFMKQSEGHVALESEPGRGTSFRLYLPRSAPVRASAAAITPQPCGELPTGSETVLVVEDNPQVRELATETISGLGYRVLEASTGQDALDILQRNGTVDLLFSDIVLPDGMNGFELVRKARALHTGLRALMTSGYANANRPVSERPDVPVLLKPYHRNELAERIRLALDQA